MIRKLTDRIAIDELLAYLGIAPFLICVLLAFGQLVSPSLALSIFNTYGLGIAWFVAGSHWSYQWQFKTSQRLWFVGLNNLLVLLLLGSFWSVSALFQLGVLVVAFLVLLLFDRVLLSAGLIAGEYWQLRRYVTTAVICLHGMMWLILREGV